MHLETYCGALLKIELIVDWKYYFGYMLAHQSTIIQSLSAPTNGSKSMWSLSILAQDHFYLIFYF